MSTRQHNISRCFVICMAAVCVLITGENDSIFGRTIDQFKRDAQEYRVEKLLLQFHNDYLGGVRDYGEKIRYPKSNDLVLAWSSLVISVSSDVAFILSYGHSEAVVKVVEHSGSATSTAVDIAKVMSRAAEAEYGKAAGEFLAGGITDISITGVEKYAGTKVPGLRTAAGVYGVYKASGEEQQKVHVAIAQQKEIQKFAGEVAPSVVVIGREISSVKSQQKRNEYQQMLAAMLQKNAEITIYRQMTRDNFTGDASLALDKAIDDVIPGRKVNNIYTANMSFVRKVNDYIDGTVSKEDFESYLREEIKARIGSLTRISIDSVLKHVRVQLRDVDTGRTKINRYGGGKSYINQCVTTYNQLKELIPLAYRIAVSTEVISLPKVPRYLKNITPNQGTTLPKTQKGSGTGSQIDFNERCQYLEKINRTLVANWRGRTWRATIPNWRDNVHSWNKSCRYIPYKSCFSGSLNSFSKIYKQMAASPIPNAPRLETELTEAFTNNMRQGNIARMVTSMGKIQSARGWRYWSRKAGLNYQIDQLAKDFQNQYMNDMKTEEGREAIRMTEQMLQSTPWE